MNLQSIILTIINVFWLFLLKETLVIQITRIRQEQDLLDLSFKKPLQSEALRQAEAS